jgi:hypothetical protein
MNSITGKLAPVRRKIPVCESAFGIAPLVLCVLFVHAGRRC